MDSLWRHTVSSWSRSHPNSENLRMKTNIPTPSSIWETCSLFHPCVLINVVLHLFLYKWQDLWQSHITKYSLLDPNMSSLRPIRLWSTSNLRQVWRHHPNPISYCQPHSVTFVVQVILQASECHSLGLNAAAYTISDGRLYSPSLHTTHYILHKGHCTLHIASIKLLFSLVGNIPFPC